MNGQIKISRLAGAIALACGAAIATAQTTNLDPIRQQRLPMGVVYSTTTVYPQIQGIKPPRPRILENEDAKHDRNTGIANNLPTGGMLNTPSGSPYLTFAGIGFTGYFPPDCDMGVSQNFVVAAVNTTLAFYKKDGTKLFQQDYGDFFKGVGIQGEILSDPKVFFDNVSKRWFTCMLEVGFSAKIGKVLVAVSDDEDPNGKWFQYRIEDVIKASGGDLWLDYPGFGCNKDGLVITGNMFPFDTGSYGGNQYIVIPKGPLLSGGSPVATSFQDTAASTMKVAVTSDATVDRVYCMGDDNTSQVRVAAVLNPGSSSPSVKTTFVTVPTFSYPRVNAAGPGGHDLDGFDGRIFNLAYRNGSLVGAHGVSLGSDSRIVCRWYQINTSNWPVSGTPTLAQSGNVTAGSGEFASMPAINMNRRNAISVLYTRSSSSIQADLMYTTHKPTDPAGFMTTPTKIKGSEGLYGGIGGNRWGDYFGVAIDPSDDLTFWGHGMVANSSGGWRTWVSNWKVIDIDSATPYYAQSPTVLQGNFASGIADSLKAVDANYYNVKSVPVSSLGQSLTWEATFKSDLTPTTVDYLAAKFNAIGPSEGTGFLFLYNWSTNTYDSVATAGIKTGISIAYEVPTTLLSKYIKSDGTIKAAVRAVSPIRNGLMPSVFSFKTDQLVIVGLKKPTS